MAPLEVEVYNAHLDDWVHIQKLDPGESISTADHLPNGGREIYVIHCGIEDLKSYVWQPVKSIIVERPGSRTIRTQGANVVAEISEGETYEMTLITQKGSTPSRIRLTHI